jgi:hypothetical protein
MSEETDLDSIAAVADEAVRMIAEEALRLDRVLDMVTRAASRYERLRTRFEERASAADDRLVRALRMVGGRWVDRETGFTFALAEDFRGWKVTTDRAPRVLPRV